MASKLAAKRDVRESRFSHFRLKPNPMSERSPKSFVCIVLLACAFAATSLTRAASRAIAIDWDHSTLRRLADGGYPRLIRLHEGTLLLSCDAGGKSVVRRSNDGGKTWSDAIVAATFDHGACANAQPLELDDGRVLLFYNERPSDGVHPYTIRMTISRDAGLTWTARPQPLYVADTVHDNGCWEPAGVQLASGELLVFFANENPYRHSNEQEIAFLRSSDRGDHWSEAAQFSFRRGARDGMPVPLLLRDGSLVVAIEDEALTSDRKLKPVILDAQRIATAPWKPILGDDPRRRGAVADPWPERVYAGAPFICQLPTGQTLLSCQNDQGRRQAQMIVYIGDEHARDFTHPSAPFDLPPNIAGQWNSLFVQDADTVIALTSARINSQLGVWSIIGYVKRE